MSVVAQFDFCYLCIWFSVTFGGNKDIDNVIFSFPLNITMSGKKQVTLSSEEGDSMLIDGITHSNYRMVKRALDRGTWSYHIFV